MAELKNIDGFQETTETVLVTMGGWDGKSYDGEGRKRRVWIRDGKKYVRCNFKGRETVFHEILSSKHPKSGITEVAAAYSVSLGPL